MLARPYYSQRAVFASPLSAFFIVWLLRAVVLEVITPVTLKISNGQCNVKADLWRSVCDTPGARGLSVWGYGRRRSLAFDRGRGGSPRPAEIDQVGAGSTDESDAVVVVRATSAADCLKLIAARPPVNALASCLGRRLMPLLTLKLMLMIVTVRHHERRPVVCLHVSQSCLLVITLTTQHRDRTAVRQCRYRVFGSPGHRVDDFWSGRVGSGHGSV